MRRCPTQQDQKMQCEATVKGTLWFVAHQDSNCRKPNGSASEPFLFPVYIQVRSETQYCPTLSLWSPGHVLCLKSEHSFLSAIKCTKKVGCLKR